MTVSARSKQKRVKTGVISIVGRPNVGKSTLLNKIVGEKIAIVSAVPQTTRNQIRGIYNDERGQIVFIDTPGLHMNRDQLDRFMNQSAYGTTQDADGIIHLVDTQSPVGQEEESIVERLAGLKAFIILGLNKVDVKGTPYLPEYISLWERVTGKTVTRQKQLTLLPLSGEKGTHIPELLDVIFEKLPAGEPLYPADAVTDVPQRMAISDIIREKFFNRMRQEIPHSLAVLVEEITPRKNKVLHMRVLVLVDTDSQKRIVVGKGGQVLKGVGIEARRELEQLLEKKIFLEIYVKEKKKWRDDPSLLEEMGYAAV